MRLVILKCNQLLENDDTHEEMFSISTKNQMTRPLKVSLSNVFIS